MGGEYQNDKTVMTAVLHIEKIFGYHHRNFKSGGILQLFTLNRWNKR